MAIWGCKSGFTAPSLCSFISPSGETRGEAVGGLCGGREWRSGVGATLGGFVSAEPRLGGMPLVPDGQGTVRPVSDVAGDVPEGGGTSFGTWVRTIWRGGEGPA